MPVHHTIHAYVASEEFYPNGSVIIEEGTVGDWVYVILEGSAKVRKKTSKGLVTVDTLKEGDVFGEMGFLEGGKRLRSASVVASGDVWVGILDGEKLTADFEMSPSNLKALIRSLVLKLREITTNVCSLASVPDEK
ncbi:MAG: cyclic nucleotide-binding domain-containing protein [Deltaproteobacteria bacterium]|nr:cyclic nucleotide-binding domain-containing protein [Deltaproteobacteria bacterium]